MDLMFDIQVCPYLRRESELPEDVLASIANYYRRVTTTASPMGHLVGAAMAITIVSLTLELALSREPPWITLASFAFSGAPIALAIARVFPNAVRLGARSDSRLQQSALARAICRDHLLCFAGILVFLALRLSAFAR
jgi:hypothetical protein